MQLGAAFHHWLVLDAERGVVTAMFENWHATKQMVDAACAYDDEVRAECAESERQRRRAEDERRTNRVRRSHHDTDVWDCPELAPPPASQVTTMNDEESAAWNGWLNCRIEVCLKTYSGSLYEVFAEKDDSRKLHETVAELRDRVLKLEATNEVLRGFITSGNRAAPPTLTSIKGGADVA